MMHIDEGVSLKDYTTFKVGGPARYLTQVRTIDQLQEVLAKAKTEKWPIFILAGGSNVIFPDAGFPGLVIVMAIEKLEIQGNKITAGAATPMHELVDASIEHGLAGLEWAGGLPGTFGGAIRGNAGAFKGEIKDSITSVTSVNHHTGAVTTRTNAKCQFGYRDSIFKHSHEVIIEATVELAPGEKTELRAAADRKIAFRQERHPMEYPNVGSIFKNFPVQKLPDSAREHFKNFIKVDPFPIIPSGKIIDDAGLKGYQVGDAQVSEKHANYIVNLGHATATDIVELICHIQKTVYQKFGINLETEPEILKEETFA
jgi:UDP-N-acetylmuramate dehydrogenase